jgi:DNA-binding CsgD family transcriptional regulator
VLRQTGEGNTLANLLAITAVAREWTGDPAGADRDIAELDVLAAAIGDGMALWNQALGHGVLSVMRADWEASIAALLPFGPHGTLAIARPMIVFLAVAEAFSDRLEEAEAHANLVPDGQMAMGGVVAAGVTVTECVVALGRNDIERAWEIAFAYSSTDAAFQSPFASTVVVLLAQTTALLGKHDEAVRIAGAVMPEARAGLWTALLGDLEPTCRAALGDERFDALWAEGEAMGKKAAVDLLKRGRGSRQRPILGWDSLTPTEADVARLVAQGLPNKKVAAELFMSEATVKTHLTRVYDKIGVRTRAQLAASARPDRAT